MSKRYQIFVVRWLFNSLGLWVAINLFGTGKANMGANESLMGFLIAGFIFSVINSILKPFIVILSLPAILLTLGLFMIVVNGVLVYISLQFVPDISMKFTNAILTGIILSLVNYIVSATVMVASKEVS